MHSLTTAFLAQLTSSSFYKTNCKITLAAVISFIVIHMSST